MARGRPRARGWYVKDGDPAGTERFWDGEKWGPQPRQKKLAPGKKAAVAAPTKEEVLDPLNFEQGTLWARISARSADILLLLLPWYYFWGQAFTDTEVVGADGVVTATTITNIVYLWLGVAVAVAYEVGFTATWGRTPGKRLMKLKVVDRDDGKSPLGWGRAFMRASPLLLLVAVLLVPVLYVASVASMRFDRMQRSVFDFAGSTMVVVATRSG